MGWRDTVNSNHFFPELLFNPHCPLMKFQIGVVELRKLTLNIHLGRTDTEPEAPVLWLHDAKS